MFKVLESAKEIENPNKFLSDYSQQRKQRRKGPKGHKQEVERRVQRSADSNEDFPSLTTLQSSSNEMTTCNSYAAVLRKGLLKDKK
jgi:hypothetical protein